MQTADKNRDPRHINRCQLPWMANKRKQFSIRIDNVPGRRRRPQKARAGRRWGNGASREGTRRPPPRSPPSPWAGTAVPEAVPMHTGVPSILAWGLLEGHSLQTGLGTGQRGRQPLPRPPQGTWQRAAVAVPGPAMPGGQQHPPYRHGVSGWQHPGEEREAWGCSAPALKDAEGFGRTTGGIWRVVLAGLSGRRRADSGKDRGLLAGGSREGHTISSG